MLKINGLLIAVLQVAVLSGCAGTVEKKAEATFYPPLPQQPRLQFLLPITGEEDIGAKQDSGLKEWLIGKQASAKRIRRPHDIASSKGRIYVLDRTFKKILYFDLEKKSLDYIRDEREGALSEPMGLWVTPDDVKYVADKGRKQVLLFDKDNQYIRAYGDKDLFEEPMDVAVYQDRVYVLDYSKMVVVVLDRESGTVLQTIGEPGTDEGKLNRPTHISVDHEGNIYVNDGFNYRVQKFDPKGNYLKHFGYQGDTLGGFARPKGVAVDHTGLVYAVDTAFENTQIFHPDTAEPLLFFGGYGLHAGSMYMPTSVNVDYENLNYFEQYADKDFKLKYLVYVGNQLGQHKLNVYGFGEWVGAPLPVIKLQPVPVPSAKGGEDPSASK